MSSNSPFTFRGQDYPPNARLPTSVMKWKQVSEQNLIQFQNINFTFSIEEQTEGRENHKHAATEGSKHRI